MNKTTVGYSIKVRYTFTCNFSLDVGHGFIILPSQTVQVPWVKLGPDYRVGQMAQYHNFWKFLAKKHCFGNK